MATADMYLLIWYLIYDGRVRCIIKDGGRQRLFNKTASSTLLAEAGCEFVSSLLYSN